MDNQNWWEILHPGRYESFEASLPIVQGPMLKDTLSFGKVV